MLMLFMLGVTAGAVLHHQRITLRVSTLSERILTAHEEERARLSRELHDGVAQSLQALRLKTKIIRSKGKSDPDGLFDQLGDLAVDVGNTLEELRTVSRDLRPATLANMRLDEALEWYAHEIDAQTGVAVKVESALDVELSKRTTEHLYRICQEAVINALRHGKASEILIRLSKKHRSIEVAIQDNGEGFPEESFPREASKGIGMVNMQDRAQLIGGTCEIESKKAMGTTITITVPLDAIDD